MNWIVVDEHYHPKSKEVRHFEPSDLRVWFWYADKFFDDFLIIRSD